LELLSRTFRDEKPITGKLITLQLINNEVIDMSSVDVHIRGGEGSGHMDPGVKNKVFVMSKMDGPLGRPTQGNKAMTSASLNWLKCSSKN